MGNLISRARTRPNFTCCGNVENNSSSDATAGTNQDRDRDSSTPDRETANDHHKGDDSVEVVIKSKINVQSTALSKRPVVS